MMIVTIKSFTGPFFDYFSWSLKRKKRVVMRAMRKKLTIFLLQLPIYYILEQPIIATKIYGLHKITIALKFMFYINSDFPIPTKKLQTPGQPECTKFSNALKRVLGSYVSINQSINQSVNQSINQSINQSRYFKETFKLYNLQIYIDTFYFYIIYKYTRDNEN